MASAGLEATIPASKWPYIHALGRAATGIFYIYEGWNFKSGNYLFTTDTK